MGFRVIQSIIALADQISDHGIVEISVGIAVLLKVPECCCLSSRHAGIARLVVCRFNRIIHSLPEHVVVHSFPEIGRASRQRDGGIDAYAAGDDTVVYS